MTRGPEWPELGEQVREWEKWSERGGHGRALADFLGHPGIPMSTPSGLGSSGGLEQWREHCAAVLWRLEGDGESGEKERVLQHVQQQVLAAEARTFAVEVSRSGSLLVLPRR